MTIQTQVRTIRTARRVLRALIVASIVASIVALSIVMINEDMELLTYTVLATKAVTLIGLRIWNKGYPMAHDWREARAIVDARA